MLPNTDDETYAKAAAELIAKYDVSKPPIVVEETETEATKTEVAV